MKVEFSDLQAMIIVDLLNMRIAELNIAARERTDRGDSADSCIKLKHRLEAILDKF
jgi:hypothetical protein